MNSDTRLPSPSREEKRKYKSSKQGGRVTHLVEHCWVALCSLQQRTARWQTILHKQQNGTTETLLTETKGLTSMRKSSPVHMLRACCSLALVNIHPVTKHLQGLTLTDRLQTELQVLAVCREEMKGSSEFRSLSRTSSE